MNLRPFPLSRRVSSPRMRRDGARLTHQPPLRAGTTPLRRSFAVVAAAATAALALPAPTADEREPAPAHPAGGRHQLLVGTSLPADGPGRITTRLGMSVPDRPILPASVGNVRPVTRVGTDPGEALETGPDAAAVIRGCESDGDYHAENPVSSASGAYQFIDSTWTWVTGLQPPASAYAPAVQDAAFHELWDDGRGASHWDASRSCWGPHLEGTTR